MHNDGVGWNRIDPREKRFLLKKDLDKVCIVHSTPREVGRSIMVTLRLPRHGRRRMEKIKHLGGFSHICLIDR